MPVEAAEARSVDAVRTPSRPTLDRVEVVAAEELEPALRSARAQVAALSLRLRSLTAAAEKAEADPSLAVSDDERAAERERRRLELEDELARTRFRLARELDRERADADARVTAARAEAEALITAANTRLDELVTQVARRVSPPEEIVESDGGPVVVPEVVAPAPIVGPVPAEPAVELAERPEVTVLLEDAGPGPDHARLVIAEPAPMEAVAPANPTTAAPAEPAAVAAVPYLTMYVPAADGQGGTTMVPVTVPAMAGGVPGAAALGMPMPMPMPVPMPYGMGHPPVAPGPVASKTFRQRFLHLDVILPLLAAVIVLVLLLAWMG